MACQLDNTNEIEQLKNQLAVWRAANKAPTPISPEIWAKAVELAATHGVGPISKTLGLGSATLKRKLGIPLRVKPSSSAAFFELFAPASHALGHCAIEVESARGAKLRLELDSVSANALGAILREFVG